MADYYCDHGAYASDLGATPTWGTPQDGDGYSISAATASSIGSIAFASVPTTGTISVCGASVSTTSVIGAATVSNAADALATNINATTNTVSSSAAFGTPQLRNLVYARGPTNGAPSGTCQIMMRIGSANLNYATNSNNQIAHTFNGTPTVTQFTGGSGGCFGWMFNPAAIGVSSSITKASYGTLSGVYVLYTGTTAPSGTDTCWIRSGDSPTIAVSEANATTFTSSKFPFWVVDTNTKWTSDPADGTITLEMTATGSGVRVWSIYGVFRCLRKYNLKFKTLTGSGNYWLIAGTNSGSGICSGLVDGVHVEGNSAYRLDTAQNTLLRWKNAKFEYPAVSATWFTVGNCSVPSSYPGRVTFTDCDWVFNYTGSAQPTGLFSTSSGSSISLIVEGGSITGTGGKKVPLIVGTVNDAAQIEVNGCDGIKLNTGLNLSGALYTGYNVNYFEPNFRYYKGSEPSGAWYFENMTSWFGWAPDASPAYPTLSALLPGTSTQWSICAAWPVGASMERLWDFELPPIDTFYRGSSGVKTIKLRFVAATGTTFSYQNFYALFVYVDSSGAIRSEGVYGSSVVSSSASWTGIPSGFSAFEVPITTSQAVKQDTLVSCLARISGKHPSGTLSYLYLDPDLDIS